MIMSPKPCNHAYGQVYNANVLPAFTTQTYLAPSITINFFSVKCHEMAGLLMEKKLLTVISVVMMEQNI